MSLIAELWSILSASQRRQVLVAQAVSLAMAFSTVTGIAAIAPFFAVLGEPRLIDSNPILHWLYIHCGLPGKRDFIVLLGSAFIAVVLLGNLINAAGSLIMTRLAMRIGNQLQTALFSDYLSRAYSFHAGINSATLVKNVVYESIRVTHGILLNALMLVASLVTAAFIICASVLLNPAVTAAAIAGLAAGYGLIYLAVRNRVLSAGRALSQLTGERPRLSPRVSAPSRSSSCCRRRASSAPASSDSAGRSPTLPHTTSWWRKVPAISWNVWPRPVSSASPWFWVVVAMGWDRGSDS
jgi:HlyD family secretion protein